MMASSGDSSRIREVSDNSHYGDLPDGLNETQLDDSAGRRDAGESVRRAAEAQRVEAIRTLGKWARGDDCDHGYYAAGGTEFCPACLDDGGEYEHQHDPFADENGKPFPEDCATWKAERDRYRKALEEIAGHFVPYQRKTYGPVDITLDAIRREAEEALADA